MIRRDGDIPCPSDEVAWKKIWAQLNRLLSILYNSANYSHSAPPGGGGGGGTSSIWTTSTRPALPSIGTRGYNTDFDGEEVYTAFGWYVLNGTWTTAGRPTGVIAGSRGFNITIPQQEYLDDTGNWNGG